MLATTFVGGEPAPRLTIGRRLNVVQFRIMSPFGYEFLMGAEFEEARTLEHDDEVRHADSGESMRHEYGHLAGAAVAPGGGGVTLEERMFGFSIERGGGLVEH